ncbi:MAG: hypothetical protein ACRAVC_22485 [Trichormus sp.]
MRNWGTFRKDREISRLQRLHSVHGEGLVMKQLDASAVAENSVQSWEYGQTII